MATLRNGYSIVDPWIISADTDAEIAFLVAVFGAIPRGEPVRSPDGRIGHAELDIDGSVVMLFDYPRTLPTHLRVMVDDIEATLERATANGATIFTNPTEMFWGEIVARFVDPQGHRWWVHQPLEIDPATIPDRMNDPQFRRNMEYVQSAVIPGESPV